MNPTLQNPSALYRIGSVSKLSGVPVPTLRIWQTRYNAFEPTTTHGQHRLYQEEDVRKAVLLKTLTTLGHGIRLIAGLPAVQLQHMLHTVQDLKRPLRPSETPHTSIWAVVGLSLAERLQSDALKATGPGPALPIRQVWEDLGVALQSTPPHMPSQVLHPIDVLWVAVNSLNAQTAQNILALEHQQGAKLTVVFYGFGQNSAVALLENAACQVHRNTLSDAALAQIVQSTRPVNMPTLRLLEGLQQPIPPRQYSDAVLQRVVNIPSQVLCECPRHVAELIGLLGRFEDYSLDCLNQSTKDSALHTQLNTVAATARALFEEALLMVATHEGISLQELA